ncbi:MAG: Lrp/AsnC family transcriptional regulator [Candidatus Thorarchaeota archaeon]
MDALDRRILDELALQCRVSFSKLAEKFGVSLNTIKNRVEALAEQGVIVDFVVQLHLDILRASFAVVMLDIKSNTGRKNLISLGDHPFIMALGLGYEMQGFAVVVYRTNAELTQAVDHLQSSEYVESTQALPVIGPPSRIDPSSSKGLDSLKKIDWRILKSLHRSGRKALGEIASDVGASVPTVRKRIAFMRKHNLIHETIQINPAASEHDLIVMLHVKSSAITQMDYFEMEMSFRNQFAGDFWISYRMANRPELMLTFVLESSKQVAAIRSELTCLFQDCEIISQIIVPEWVFFPDFRDEIVDAHLE